MKYLAACCTVKNEETIILDWMAFHRAVGFEHLVVIDHSSTDRTAQIVRSFRDQSVVTLERFDEPGSQMDMYNSVAKRYRDRFHWCAFIDADEFLYSAERDDFREVMSEYEAASAVGVHWLLYGSSGHLDTQPGLVTETYIKRAHASYIGNRHVKSIVKLSAARVAQTSHYFDVEGITVDENFQELPSRPPHGYYPELPATHARLRLNHYHVRSQADYLIKARRGFFGDEVKLGTEGARKAMFAEHDRNDVEDTTALRYSALMRFYADGAIQPFGRRW